MLPTCLEPLADTDIATKNYTDTQVKSVVRGASISSAGSTSFSNTFWGSDAVAVSVQIIGAGGGSTSFSGDCTCSGSGVAGGSGSQASIFILTNTLAGNSSYGSFEIIAGTGGKAGIGCGEDSSSGGGTPTNFNITPSAPYDRAKINILRANGGGGFLGTCGQSGSSTGGIYSNINPLILSPLSSSNGTGGNQCDGAVPNYYGINTIGSTITDRPYKIGWGSGSGACVVGGAGFNGGFGITQYLF